MRRKPFLLVAFAGGSRLDPAGSFVPTNTKQALSNMLQRRSGGLLQPPPLHVAAPQPLIPVKLLQQQRLLRQAQARPFPQVRPRPWVLLRGVPGLHAGLSREHACKYLFSLHFAVTFGQIRARLS